ncbi:hypothetical protein BCP8-2_139 [Bacillus phage BCP8-2]|uniref:Uncharacterized protein n=1 Tax=Bacillus phage BCP8-2 TaxID=1129192 RepID=A0A0E3D9L7_9CAUD|nr:hypothetical protein BCP8-2_139 [Bacillus phage BCP8-2]AHJ87177.1 hypothetical protein BCP8-2_139 [Bacillus phage BCP8-2]
MTRKKTGKPNAVQRSMSRGLGSRGDGTKNINDNGKDAYKRSRQSTKGIYRVGFTEMFERVTERDIELKHTYAKDLLSNYLKVPVDMIHLKVKRKPQQTLTSVDEVFYVKVGSDIYGKVSIRVQRVLRGNILIFVFQEKAASPKPPAKSYSRKTGFKKKTSSQVSQTKRKSYHSRQGGKS